MCPRAQSSPTPWPYLPPAGADGCRYCFDPDSALLRRALTAPRGDPDALLPAEALGEDLRFFYQLLRKQYAGYPDLVQQRDFDVEAFFSDWLRMVRTAGKSTSLREGIIEPLIALQQVHADRHLTFLAAQPVLERALGATVIGERTAGVMQYGEARRFVLPATGLVCQLPTKRFFFDEEVEGVGWRVDVYLEDIGMAAEQLVPHLNRLHAAVQSPEDRGA